MDEVAHCDFRIHTSDDMWQERKKQFEQVLWITPSYKTAPGTNQINGSQMRSHSLEGWRWSLWSEGWGKGKLTPTILILCFVPLPNSSRSGQLWTFGPGGRHVVSKYTTCHQPYFCLHLLWSIMCSCPDVWLVWDQTDKNVLFVFLLSRSVGVITYIL